MPKKSQFPVRIPSARAEDQPATRKMLTLVRDELKSDIRSLESKMDSRFADIDSRLATMSAEIAHMGILFEEQNANNRIVLEGLQALWQRQERFEKTLATR